MRPAQGFATRIYIYAMCLAAIGVAGMAVVQHPIRLSLSLFLFAVPAILAGSRSIRLGGRVEMLANQPFLFATLIAAGVSESILAAFLSAVAFSLARSRPLPLDRVLFNTASLTLTQAATGFTYVVIGGQLRSGLTLANVTPRLMIGAFVFFVVNSVTVSVVVALSERKSVFGVWWTKFLWSFLTPFASVSLAIGMAIALTELGPWALLLAAPPTLLVYYSYQLYRARQEADRQRLLQVRQMNVELEEKVRLRTAELREVNEELGHSNRRLEEASRMKSEFLATMSHELRTPLNAIIGFSELLLDPRICQLDEEPADYAQDILTSGRHLLDMINDILDLSKVEAGRMDLNLEETDLHVVVHEALSMIVPMAERKTLKLETGSTEDEVLLLADPVKLRQMLYNLLSNAAKFTPEEGKVHVSWTVRGPDVQITVRDTGIGIAAGDQERIFRDFMQVDSSLGRRYTGTGLGLALVKKFVEMHGGSVRVDSKPGEGAAFTLSFPGARIEPAADPEKPGGDSPVPPSPDGHGESVLVIEDNPVNRKLVRHLLQAAGYGVREAICARSGIDAAQEKPPDLILMDIQLPDMDGLEAARLISEDPRTRDIPIVALTAHATEGDEDRAYRAGCVGFLRKPIDAVEFSAHIRKHLDRSLAAASAGGE